MKSFAYQWLFFVLIYIKSTYHYPTGAPSQACTTMIPGHGVSSQACSANYIIQADKTQYYTNDTVRITVSGATSSDTFRGVLVIAKTASSSQIIGSWSVSNGNLQTLACGGIANTGVTHTSNNDKSSIQAVWTPPSTVSAENTVIKVTVVKVFSTIYVDCFSVTLMNKQNIQSSTAATNMTAASIGTSTISSSTTTIATTTVTQTSTAGVNVGWTYANGVTDVKMKINNLQTSQWFAIGLSLDQSMGNDHVFVCKRLADDTVTVERRVNPGGHDPPVLASTISNPGGTFNMTSGKLADGVVYCEFTLSNFSGSKRRRRAVFTLTQTASYYPLIATGNLDSSNQLTQHTYRSALSQSVQLNQQETIFYNLDASDSPRISLAKAHGIIMIFAWILFASTGILIARYFKPSWPEQKACGKAIWFAIHRPVMISVVVLTIIGFILILVYTKGTWVPKSLAREFAHSIIGIITIIFALIQPIMALFRCTPDAENRFIFNYAHRFVGLTALLLSTVAIFIAMFFTEFNFQGNAQWGLLIAWTCWIFFIFIIFWLLDFYFEEDVSQEKPDDSYDLGQPTPENKPPQTRNKIMHDRVKLAFLILHILVALGIAIALASLIGNS